MKTETNFKLPCGISDFRTLRTQNYAYVDKTRFIELLENESNHSHLFIRPPKFGKTLFLSTLMNYYDINTKDEFEELFGDLYIGKHPTPKRNSYAILKFDFTGLNISEKDTFVSAFEANVQASVRDFFVRYRNVFSEADWHISQIDERVPSVGVVREAFYASMKEGIKIYLFIDEGDYFARHIVATGSLPDEYMEMYPNYRNVNNFYENIESGKNHGNIDRIFVAGVSTSGLSEASSLLCPDNLSRDYKYHEMMGFTRDEADKLLDGVKLGVDEGRFKYKLEPRYGGYVFNERATENKLYNPGISICKMDLEKRYEYREPILDEETIDSYSALRTLLKNKRNTQKMLNISKTNRIIADIDGLSPFTRIKDENHLITHLFQLGLLSIDKPDDMGGYELRIPNQYARCIFNHYIYKERLSEYPEKIIFLDIDGVLQPYGTQKRFDHITYKNTDNTGYLSKELIDELYEKHGVHYGVYDAYDVAAVYYDWDKNAVAELKRILETTGAKIVISSDWRDETIDRMIDLCKIHDLDDYIIDATIKDYSDNIRAKNEEKYKDIHGYRPLEITYYLDTHPQVQKYVAIDDIPLTEELGEKHAVVTRNKLKPEDADKCIKLLGKLRVKS